MSDNPLNRAMAAVVAASGRFPDGSSIRSLTYSQRKAVVAAVIESLRTITPEMKVALENNVDDRTLAALDASILHWEQNAAAKKPGDASCGPDDCALCDVFNDVRIWPCRGCPVFERTGEELCRSSPYVKASIAYKRWLSAAPGEASDRGDEFRALAREEAEFLRSLRPVGERAVDP